MERTINLKRGLDLHLEGEADAGRIKEVKASRVAIAPADFPGFVPKLDVREGDEVAVGTVLMHDKVVESVKIVSPVSGVVAAVVRGERRRILRVVIDVDGKETVADAPAKATTADEVAELLATGGVVAMMRQRPYDVVPNPAVRPRDIFVTAFDSAPLAADLNLAVAGKDAELEAGVKALKMLTDGEVYLSTRSDFAAKVPDEAVHVVFEGPHPAGNAGVQAANIAPINKGEVVWTLDVTTLIRVGELMMGRQSDWSTLVAVTGSEVEHPEYVKTSVGAAVEAILEGNVKADGKHHRIISGNVLTGATITDDDFLHYPYHQITVIPEGDDVDDFMGWASMSPKKMSVSRSFPSHFFSKRLFAPDARLLGGRRAMIMSGEYDKVLPMDILPEYLLKAIISRDIDKMEALGIYEVAPEDMALCEYVDPSKIEVQKIVREGLDYLRKELE